MVTDGAYSHIFSQTNCNNYPQRIPILSSNADIVKPMHLGLDLILLYG